MRGNWYPSRRVALKIFSALRNVHEMTTTVSGTNLSGMVLCLKTFRCISNPPQASHWRIQHGPFRPKYLLSCSIIYEGFSVCVCCMQLNWWTIRLRHIYPNLTQVSLEWVFLTICHLVYQPSTPVFSEWWISNEKKNGDPTHEMNRRTDITSHNITPRFH